MQVGTREPPGATPLRAPRSWRRPNVGDTLFRVVVTGFGMSVLVLAVLMVYQLIFESRDSVRAFGWGFLIDTRWDPVNRVFGAAPAIYGTVVSSVIAVVLAVPVSLGMAIYLSEMAPPWLRNPVSFLVESLAAIPSVVFGLWGIYVLVPWVRDPVERVLGGHLGFL